MDLVALQVVSCCHWKQSAGEPVACQGEENGGPLHCQLSFAMLQYHTRVCHGLYLPGDLINFLG